MSDDNLTGDSRHGGYGHECWDGCDAMIDTPTRPTPEKHEATCPICGHRHFKQRDGSYACQKCVCPAPDDKPFVHDATCSTVWIDDTCRCRHDTPTLHCMPDEGDDIKRCSYDKPPDRAENPTCICDSNTGIVNPACPCIPHAPGRAEWERTLDAIECAAHEKEKCRAAVRRALKQEYERGISDECAAVKDALDRGAL